MGKLFLVPTPIGNLSDMTFRGVEVLKSAAYILAEDTRVSRKILQHFEIENKLISLHSANEHRLTHKHVDFLAGSEENLAMISDAGTPGLSDPGYLIVKYSLEKNIPVECLPGATAFLPALIESGLPSDRFCFEGFLPHKKGRQKRLKELSEESRTIVFYESPYRVLKLFQELIDHIGEDRQASFSRELTKLHGETVRGTVAELYERLANTTKIKGEFVIVVAGKQKK